MCLDPISMAAIGAGISAIGTIAGGYAQFQQGKYQQKVDYANATNAQMTADQNELIQRDKASRDMASQAVALSSQGTRIDTGTPLLLMGESARNAELDALAIRNEGIQKGQAYRAEGDAAAAQGRAAYQASFLSAAGSLLSNKSFLDTLGKI
jgi:coproporphyrinogen III oxidase-like Fe-S oxidoreductase